MKKQKQSKLAEATKEALSQTGGDYLLNMCIKWLHNQVVFLFETYFIILLIDDKTVDIYSFILLLWFVFSFFYN